MCDGMDGTNDRLVKIPGKLTLLQSKCKAVASIKGFTKALEPGFERRLPEKEHDNLSDSIEDKEKAKNNINNALAVHL